MKHPTDQGTPRRAPRPRKGWRALLLLGLALPISAVAASCATDLPAPLLDEGCTLNSDCNAPLVCAFQLCHTECQTTRDCPPGERCVAGERPYHVCQLPSEKDCISNSQCVMGELCAADGQCRDQCAADRDCTPGQLCVGGACAEPSEVNDAGTLADIPTDAGVGLSCQLSSDCGDAGLVCRQGVCAVQCNQDIDCEPPEGPGGLCVQHVCVVPAAPDAAPQCQLSSDCGDAGLVCRQGVCAVQCAADIDCEPPGGPGGVCVLGRCEVPDAGAPDAPPDAPPGYGQGCNLPSDCPSPLKCGNAGQCVYACDLDVDCGGGGLCCVGHECATGAACGGPPDAGPVDDAGPCTHCVGNDECQDGLFCDGEERCFAGCCAPALDTPCSSHSACIQDSCDEATKTCAHLVIAGQDVDGDGHLAFGCAGGDDCDDGDPTVYTGHVESFDGKDNDCNGYVDDWTSEPRGPTPLLANTDGPARLGVPVGGASGGWLAGEFNGALQLQAYDNTWTPTGPLQGPACPTTTCYEIAAASEVGTALFLAEDHDTGWLLGFVVESDGTPVGTVILDATNTYAYPAADVLADVAWGGNGYIAGWVEPGGFGSYALVDTGANLGATKAVPTGGMIPGGIMSNSVVRVAGNGSTLAVAYQRKDNNAVEIAVLDQSGAPIFTYDVSSIMDISPIFLAVAGAQNGYVVLWAHDGATWATFVPELANVGTTTFLADPGGVASLARGASDGTGAAFIMQYVDGVSFGYLNGSAKNPFELGQIAAAGTLANIAGGTGGRLGVFYTLGPTMFGRQAGYAGLPGQDCAAGSNCASGVCNPVVASGPMAYSVCQ